MPAQLLAPAPHGRPQPCGGLASPPFGELLGQSPAMRRVFDLIAKVAPANTPVLITGESGTGKELVAIALHHQSGRRARPFVSQNCSALNDNLLESELFGHLRGAFTGAHSDKPGLFAVAHGGTLFLDEVNEMSPALQAKLLRAVQFGELLPVGATQPRRVDVRLISAANQPLKDLVRLGAFREDLYYRLAVFTIELPPLRERREDIPLILSRFVPRCCEANSLPPKRLAPEVMAAFNAYTWPGNVRELENEVQRALILARHEPTIALEHLSAPLREAAEAPVRHRGRRIDGDLATALERLERDMLAEALQRYAWNKSSTARALGISRANLVAKVRKYGLQPSHAAASQ